MQISNDKEFEVISFDNNNLLLFYYSDVGKVVQGLSGKIFADHALENLDNALFCRYVCYKLCYFYAPIVRFQSHTITVMGWLFLPFSSS